MHTYIASNSDHATRGDYRVPGPDGASTSATVKRLCETTAALSRLAGRGTACDALNITAAGSPGAAPTLPAIGGCSRPGSTLTWLGK
jgi:hypothetical protein